MATSVYRRLLNLRPQMTIPRIWRSENASEKNSERGIVMEQLLKKRFPQATAIQVDDISGGCGAMYEIIVEAPELKGLTLVKQHQLVNETLKEQIKEMHGLRIHTSVPS